MNIRCFAVVIGVIFISIFSSFNTVQAHRPIFVDSSPSLADPVEIIDPEVSWAIYGQLEEGEVDYFRFTVPSGGIEFYAQMTVPKRGGEQEFVQWFAIIGTELSLDDSISVELPYEHGAVLVPPEDAHEEFFEPFTQTQYLLCQNARKQLLPGVYYLAVFHPDDDTGKYSLTVGEREVWGWRDLLRFPGIWLRVRLWYNTGQTISLLISIIVIGFMLVFFSLSAGNMIFGG